MDIRQHRQGSVDIDALLHELRACRLCREAPAFGAPLPHPPRPIIQASATARLCIASQAPGTRAHASGRPFTDASGVRLRHWLGLDEATFYDAARVAIVPMGHCFPGQDAKGGDLPPRRECAARWRAPVFDALPELRLILCIGQYAQGWHMPERFSGRGSGRSSGRGSGRGGARGGALTATVADWRAILASPRQPRILPLPHPSWRNNGWLKANPWFEAELVPALRTEVAAALEAGKAMADGAQNGPCAAQPSP